MTDLFVIMKKKSWKSYDQHKKTKKQTKNELSMGFVVSIWCVWFVVFGLNSNSFSK